MMKTLLTSLFLGATLLSQVAAAEVITDISDWVVENEDTTDANWTYDGESNSWFQSVNTSDLTVLYDPSGQSLGKAISGDISVQTIADDDYIGFVVGYNEGDKQGGEDTGYLLLSWKQATQGSLTVGMDLFYMENSLYSSSVYGSSSQPISRSNDYENVGWDDFVEYSFDIAYSGSYLAIYVNDELQYSITPGDAGVETFNEGSFGFYNFSQSSVLYGGVEYDEISELLTEAQLTEIASVVPVSGGVGLGLAMLGFGAWRRKNENRTA
jgi:hypothetical protein